MEIKEVIRVLYRTLSDKQQKFWDVYLEKDMVMSATSNILGISQVAGNKYKHVKAISIMVDLVKNQDTDLKEYKKLIPTLEWTLGEYTKMYQSVLDRINSYEREFNTSKDTKYLEIIDKLENKQQNLLKDIKDYQKKFGDKIDEDDLKLKEMTLDELIKDFNKYKEEVGRMLLDSEWKEKVA